MSASRCQDASNTRGATDGPAPRVVDFRGITGSCLAARLGMRGFPLRMKRSMQARPQSTTGVKMESRLPVRRHRDCEGVDPLDGAWCRAAGRRGGRCTAGLEIDDKPDALVLCRDLHVVGADLLVSPRFLGTMEADLTTTRRMRAAPTACAIRCTRADQAQALFRPPLVEHAAVSYKLRLRLHTLGAGFGGGRVPRWAAAPTS
jgi:hypothetical protein